MPIPTPVPTLARSLGRLLPALLLTAAWAQPHGALAQSPYGATVQALLRPGDPAELLAQALRTLAVEPSNLAALTAAGHNALVLGDPNAAVGFFGRAQEIAPRDGHVKAGLGSALVELEKPQDALRLFAEASRLGVPDDELAEDRGLAYDLTGDPRKAQRDYATVLAARPDDDLVRRRLALSQGISGDKAAAIATLDPLIRRRDIAGWRAQTFVLAMTGDTKGASDITHIMLPQQADMLQPFLVRLATLSPADKARAVNFGEMPAAGRAYTPTELANTGAAPTYAGSPNAARPAPASRVAARASDLAPIPSRPQPTPAARVTMAAPASAAPTSVAPTPAATPAAPPVAIARANPPSAVSGPPVLDLPTAAPVGHYDLPHDTAVHATSRTVGAPVVHKAKATPAVVALAEPEPANAKPAPSGGDTASKPTKTHTEVADDAHPTRRAKAKPPSASTDDSEPDAKPLRKGAHTRLADDDETDDTTSRKDRKAAHGKSAAADDGADDGSAKHRKGARGTRLASADEGDDTQGKKRTRGKKTSDDDSDAKSSKSSKKNADKAAPERVFVQVAGGANKDDMDKAWAGVKKKAPELMKGRTPQTAPVHATNRLLVGPFKSDEEAQAFVNKMAGKGLSGFTVKTPKGAKVEKVDTGQ